MLILPPTVPMALIWGPPTVSAARPSTGMRSMIMGESVSSTKVVVGPMWMQPSSVSFMPWSSGTSWMDTRSQPAYFPSRILISTSVPPEMTRAFSLAESAATASATLLARTIFSKSNIRSAPFR